MIQLITKLDNYLFMLDQALMHFEFPFAQNELCIILDFQMSVPTFKVKMFVGRVSCSRFKSSHFSKNEVHFLKMSFNNHNTSES